MPLYVSVSSLCQQLSDDSWQLCMPHSVVAMSSLVGACKLWLPLNHLFFRFNLDPTVRFCTLCPCHQRQTHTRARDDRGAVHRTQPHIAMHACLLLATAGKCANRCAHSFASGRVCVSANRCVSSYASSHHSSHTGVSVARPAAVHWPSRLHTTHSTHGWHTSASHIHVHATKICTCIIDLSK